MPVNNHIDALIIKHLQETITEDEKIILNEWISADDNHRAMFDRFTNNELLHQDLVAYSESDRRIKEQVYAQLPEVQGALTIVPKRRWMRYASLAAAVVIGIAIVGFWYWKSGETDKTNGGTPTQTQVATVIPAGGNKATLTLADGTVIDLDKASNGTIAKEGKTVVSKREDGQLEYQGSHSPLTTHNSPVFNMLSTPRGGQYQLLLPDGSKVWLNAASSIRYPTAFAGNERRVEVSGELYFEITKNIEKPFKVTIIPSDGSGRGGEVEVLGTHFNINAYGDEQAIVTTLLEGKIKISAIELVSKQSGGTDMNNHKPETTNHKLLLPGEEAQINKDAAIVVRKNVDTEASVAWMKGFFDFHNAGIKSVMKQVSRWYNVDVQYAGPVPAQTFEGNLDRNIPLNELLALLNQMGKTNFTIDGRTVRVQ
jgi:transmembrane sensor